MYLNIWSSYAFRVVLPVLLQVAFDRGMTGYYRGTETRAED
jgi:hypothetical protein